MHDKCEMRLNFASYSFKTLTIMQKTTLLCSAICIAIATMIGSTKVFSKESKETTQISLRKTSPGTGNNANAPRSLSIEAYYDSDNSCVYASLNDMGALVDVYIENIDTEEQRYYQIPGSGGSVMPISGSSGEWVITFILSNGDEYVGEFYL